MYNDYLAPIQNDLAALLAAAERAADTLENSQEYKNHLHPFHAAAVNTYNKFVSVLIEFERLKTPEPGPADLSDDCTMCQYLDQCRAGNRPPCPWEMIRETNNPNLK